MDEEVKTKGIDWFMVISIVVCIVGIIVISSSNKIEKYSTEEYWVAKDYHHVYDKYSGEIVDYIEKNETCKIDGNTITVTKTDYTLNTVGWILMLLGGGFFITIIIEKHKEKK